MCVGNLYVADSGNQRVREVGGVGPVSVATTTMAPTSSTRYDGDGHAVSTTDANGHTATTAYDPLGRAVVQTNPISGTSIMTYTATELQQQRDAQGNVTAYAYDNAGRPVTVSSPMTGTVQFQYDAAGNTVAVTTTDAAVGGAVMILESLGYDALKRVSSANVVSGSVTLTVRTAYTRAGQVAQTQAPNGDTTTTSYDLADEALSTTLLSNGTTTTEGTYSYDGAGNQATRTDTDGRTVTTVYDPDNRVTQTTATGGGTVTVATTMGYDPDGNTVAETAQTTDSAPGGQVQVSTHAATYDAGDRVATETDNGLTTVYGYDAQGQQRVATVQDGQTAIATALDAEGRVTSISEGAGNAGPYVSSFTYNTNDQLQAFTLPGGVRESVQYDPNSQVVGVTALGPNTNGMFTTLSSQYRYTYDAANRVNSTTTLSGTDALAYDGPGRLTSETQQTGHQIIATGGKYAWTYDGNGNILTAIDDTGATDVYTYSTTIRDELTQMGATDNPVTKTNAYSYDGRGDVTSIANTAPSSDKNALSQHLSYDSQGRVTQVTYLDHNNGNTTTTITIAYNADGQRADYTYTPWGQPPLDTQFQYRNGQLAEQRVISDTTANGPVVIYTNTYLYGPQGEPLELLHAQPGQTVARYWYTLDGQGSVVALTDANGSVVDRYAYDSWGESTSDDRTNEHVPQQLRYKAQYYDEKLTWYWLGGRYYDPETERYLQPDTNSTASLADIGSLLDASVGARSFAYGNNNPLGARLDDGAPPPPGCNPDTGCDPTIPPTGDVDPCITPVLRDIFCGGGPTYRAKAQETLNRGVLQIQGDDIRGMANAKGDTISWKWSQVGTVTVKKGLSELANLWKQLNRRQQGRRDQAYARAQRFIRGGPPSGISNPGGSFENDRGKRDGVNNARIDVVVSLGIAFER